MKAEHDGSGEPAPMEYVQCFWGDVIYGTKEQLQAIGIAPGQSFPGEPGANRLRMQVRDPRGFATKLKFDYDGIRYVALISFPGPSEPNIEPKPYARGVTKREHVWVDEFEGSASNLAAAGLVREDQLPGQPGMRKTCVTIFPNGDIPTGPPQTNYPAAREPGAKSIERASSTTWRISVRVSKEEGQQRLELYKQVRREWEMRMDAMPRPAQLTAATPAPRRAHLRVAWSAPA